LFLHDFLSRTQNPKANGMHLFGMEVTVWQALALALSAFLSGFAKTGIVGIGSLITPILASAFPTGIALGLLLPLQLFTDLCIIFVMKRRPLWRVLKKTVFWSVVGIFAGWQTAKYVNDAFGPEADARLRLLVGMVMAAVVALSFYVSRHPGIAMSARPGPGSEPPDPASARTWYTAFLATFGGMASMLTNSGGPIWAMYYSSLGMEVQVVINTSAWSYFIMNSLKIPLSTSLGFLDWNMQKITLILVPVTAAGLFAGAAASRKFSKKSFGLVVRVLAACGAAYMIAT
jgi:uncharacterized membrane protein YfcA